MVTATEIVTNAHMVIFKRRFHNRKLLSSFLKLPIYYQQRLKNSTTGNTLDGSINTDNSNLHTNLGSLLIFIYLVLKKVGH